MFVLLLFTNKGAFIQQREKRKKIEKKTIHSAVEIWNEFFPFFLLYGINLEKKVSFQQQKW
jgi:hypothetical protein